MTISDAYDDEMEYDIDEEEIEEDTSSSISTLLVEQDVTQAAVHFENTPLYVLGVQLLKLIGLQSDVNPIVAELGREILAELSELTSSIKSDPVSFIMDTTTSLDYTTQRDICQALAEALVVRTATLNEWEKLNGGHQS